MYFGSYSVWTGDWDISSTWEKQDSFLHIPYTDSNVAGISVRSVRSPDKADSCFLLPTLLSMYIFYRTLQQGILHLVSVQLIIPS